MQGVKRNLREYHGRAQQIDGGDRNENGQPSEILARVAALLHSLLHYTRQLMPASAAEIERALKHLRKSDPVLREVIRKTGPFALKLKRDRFQALVYSILSQQISGKAANAVRRKLEDLAGPAGITPQRLSALSLEELRSAGLSKQKASYVLDLACRVHEGTLPLERLARCSDDSVIESLTEVRGIGVWTAHMFLIFSLGRLDVLPHGDYGVRSAIQKLYDLDELPNRETCCRIAEPWRPYASIASWYCWRSLEL
jgi:DNA-3-methyladenine glycosylase II